MSTSSDNYAKITFAQLLTQLDRVKHGCNNCFSSEEIKYSQRMNNTVHKQLNDLFVWGVRSHALVFGCGE
jgi:hypothetical protein